MISITEKVLQQYGMKRNMHIVQVTDVREDEGLREYLRNVLNIEGLPTVCFYFRLADGKLSEVPRTRIVGCLSEKDFR
jgi:hypothetical protein